MNKLLILMITVCVMHTGLSQQVFPDSSKVEKNEDVLIRPYNEVITGKVVTQSGLITVHKVKEKYYFEIPDSLFERDILIVTRISKAAAENRSEKLMLGFAGDLISQNVVRFTRGPGNLVFMKSISYQYRSSDTSENGMYHSVKNSNFQPIVATFHISCFSPNQDACIVEVTDFLDNDNDLISFNSISKIGLGLTSLQSDKSYIASIHTFPLNVEIKTVKTYKGRAGFMTYELNNSIVLLPMQPMTPRYYDERVGFFTTSFHDFDANSQGVEQTKMIIRWRMEPKAGDVDKYKKGELVEPKKPIVFYIDPSTPKKWVPYLIQGVNDWQQAFTKAGFKNAIYAVEAPLNDSEWSLEDARHNAIVYKPSSIRNASGPNIHDPRSGEILESHINWHHNIMKLLADWYFVQTAAIDSRARGAELNDTLMGKLIRYVVSHEIGHTLGLRHNFGASSTVPVEKLRNKKWVEENGICSSIMDYARFNYVAQPGDSITDKGIFPRIGPYDNWAIEWGYTWFDDTGLTDDNGKRMLSKWIDKELSVDKRLWFGDPNASLDPRCQAEDLGDDPLKASKYGIENLKYIMSNLIKWSESAPQNYVWLSQKESLIINQYKLYLSHVAKLIGGRHYDAMTSVRLKNVYSFVSRERQKAAVRFLGDQLFGSPSWLFNKNIFSVTSKFGVYQAIEIQKYFIDQVLSEGTLGNLLLNEYSNIEKPYTVHELLMDLTSEVWEELKKHSPVSVYKRNLQKIYVDKLISFISVGNNVKDEQNLTNYQYSLWNDKTDISSEVRGNIKEVISMVEKGRVYYSGITRLHFDDIYNRLRIAISNKQ